MKSDSIPDATVPASRAVPTRTVDHETPDASPTAPEPDPKLPAWMRGDARTERTGEGWPKFIPPRPVVLPAGQDPADLGGIEFAVWPRLVPDVGWGVMLEKNLALGRLKLAQQAWGQSVTETLAAAKDRFLAGDVGTAYLAALERIRDVEMAVVGAEREVAALQSEWDAAIRNDDLAAAEAAESRITGAKAKSRRHAARLPHVRLEADAMRPAVVLALQPILEATRSEIEADAKLHSELARTELCRVVTAAILPWFEATARASAAATVRPTIPGLADQYVPAALTPSVSSAAPVAG